MLHDDDRDPPRVLIAEDETIIRLDLRLLLEEHGFEVCAEARNGLEAVELARTEAPDVAILDMRMPELDGIEAARRIYAERPIPMLMLTAYSDRPLVDRAIEAGIFTYLSKPFRAADVVPAVHSALARHADLLAARREVGRQPATSFDITLRSPAGNAYPLRVERRDDGALDVSVNREPGAL